MAETEEYWIIAFSESRNRYDLFDYTDFWSGPHEHYRNYEVIAHADEYDQAYHLVCELDDLKAYRESDPSLKE